MCVSSDVRQTISCILYHTYGEKDKQNYGVTKRILYTGSADKTVRGWDREVEVMYCVCVYKYDVQGGIRKFKYEGHRGPITCIVAKNCKIYSMSYDILYSASADGTIRANDIQVNTYMSTQNNISQTSQCLLELCGHEGAITCMVEWNDVLYTGSVDNSIRAWDRLVYIQIFMNMIQCSEANV